MGKYRSLRASLVAQTVKNLPAIAGNSCNAGNVGLIPVRKIPWRNKWLPTPVFLPGEFYGHRSLVGYSPWGLNESDTTK